MKNLILTVLVVALSLNFCLAQSKSEQGHRNFPVIVTLTFHSLTFPFRDIRTNFANVGLGLATEVSHNGKQNWVQQFGIAWFRNKAIGNSIFLSTQTVWRPTVKGNIYSEIKLGAGYSYNYRPVESFKPGDEGWQNVKRKGKGMFAPVAGISAGYNKYSEQTYFSPFVSYQFMILKGYNKSIPLVPETFFQIGSRVHIK